LLESQYLVQWNTASPFRTFQVRFCLEVVHVSEAEIGYGYDVVWCPSPKLKTSQKLSVSRRSWRAIDNENRPSLDQSQPALMEWKSRGSLVETLPPWMFGNISQRLMFTPPSRSGDAGHRHAAEQRLLNPLPLSGQVAFRACLCQVQDGSDHRGSSRHTPLTAA
jgi:hypothetical protein